MGEGRAKILEISSYPPPRSGWGVRVQFLKSELTKRGHVCVVLNIGKSRKIKSDEYECVMDGLDYLLKVIKYSSMGFVVHAHTNGDTPKGFLLTLLAEFINLVFGKRCFLTFHAGVDQIYFPREHCRWLVPMFYIMFKIPGKVICNNEAVKEKIVEYGIPPEKVVPIPAFSPQYVIFQEAQLPESLEYFMQKRQPVLFTYVKFRNGFYLSTLFKAFQILLKDRPSVGLVIVGPGELEDSEIEEEVDLIESLGLKENILLIEDLPHDAFLTAMKRSALYLRTPTTDGIASSVLEALTLDVPVVASENGSRPEGVVTYKADDEHDLVAKVSEVLGHVDGAKTLIQQSVLRDTLREEIELLTAHATGEE